MQFLCDENVFKETNVIKWNEGMIKLNNHKLYSKETTEKFKNCICDFLRDIDWNHDADDYESSSEEEDSSDSSDENQAEILQNLKNDLHKVLNTLDNNY